MNFCQLLTSAKLVLMYRSCLNFVESLVKRENKNQVQECRNTADKGIYHEHQVKELCALHALNNLFQSGSAFTKQTLDNICHSLSPDNIVNPHKSMLGLGNYDVNVIMAALQQKGYEAVWFDKRKDPSCIALSKIKGFILNIPSEMKFGFIPLPLNRKHWIAVREIKGTYYNLDSKLDAPVPLGKENELLSYLREQINGKEREIFVVVRQEIERTSAWRTDLNKQDVFHSLSGSSVSTTILSTDQEQYNQKAPANVITAFVSPASLSDKKMKNVNSTYPQQLKVWSDRQASFSISDSDVDAVPQ